MIDKGVNEKGKVVISPAHIYRYVQRRISVCCVFMYTLLLTRFPFSLTHLTSTFLSLNPTPSFLFSFLFPISAFSVFLFSHSIFPSHLTLSLSLSLTLFPKNLHNPPENQSAATLPAASEPENATEAGVSTYSASISPAALSF